jgi:hypothetical protein
MNNELPGSQVPSPVRRRGIAGHPETDQLLAADDSAARFGDYAADDSQMGLEHGVVPFAE